jgi:hypothetical protein
LGVLVFTHEVLHTVGVTSEAAATCYALQLTPLMSRLLGTDLRYGGRLAQLLGRWYRRENLAPGYWSPQCRDGGRLDLSPDAAGWPWPEG